MALNYEAWDAPATWAPAVLPTSFAAAQAIITARYADRGFLTQASDSPAHDLYEARLMSDVDIGQSIIDVLTVGGRVALTVSELEFWNGDDAFNDVAAFGRMDGRTVRIRTSPVTSRAASDWGGSLAGATLVWQGEASRIDAMGLRARLALGDVSNRLGTQLQTLTYDGAGGTGGVPELKGLPKPISIGNRFNVTPVFVGQVDLGAGALPTYQTHYRAIMAHDAVRIRGVAQAQVTSSPGIGQFLDYPTLGMFQLGSSPDGVVTCDVRGDAPSGAYAKSIGDAVRTVLTALGPGFVNADFDANSWFDFGAAMLQEVGWGIGAEAITTEQALTEILSSAGVWLSGSRSGKIRIARLGIPSDTPNLSLTLGDILDLQPESLPASLQPTPQAVEILAARNWTPLTDIAGSVSNAQRAALTSPGSFSRSLSNSIAARSTQARTLRLEGLYRYSADALTRADELKTWLERGLRVIKVVTDRYLGQVELGHTCQITYPYFGLSGGWSGTVVAWREKIGARRLELTVIG